ncbi:MAG: NnrU family protein, partial [Salinisphaeraceae bacterium]|nr:NnrU family protein [Salinisphaeraceae bacterium]
VQADWLRTLLWAVYVSGWLLTFAATFMHNHFDLMGVRQVWRYFRGKPQKPAPFRERALYKYIRHPLMLGLLIAFWATPQMTVGHLVFALGMTAYIFIGVAFEERDLLRAYGQKYAQFRASRPMLIPRPRGISSGQK